MISHIDTKKMVGSYAVTTASGATYNVMSTADKGGYALISGGSLDLPQARAKMEDSIIRTGEPMDFLHPAGNGLTSLVTEIKPISIFASATQ